MHMNFRKHWWISQNVGPLIVSYRTVVRIWRAAHWKTSVTVTDRELLKSSPLTQNHIFWESLTAFIMYWIYWCQFFFLHVISVSYSLVSVSITLILYLPRQLIQNWPEKQKSFPALLLLKRIVLHLSMAFCLTGYVCQLFLLSELGGKKKKKTDQERGRKRKSLTLPDAHLPQRRDKRERQKTQGSKITLLCLHLIFFLFPLHLHGRYISAGASKLGEKVNSLRLQDPRTPWRTAKWTKS